MVLRYYGITSTCSERDDLRQAGGFCPGGIALGDGFLGDRETEQGPGKIGDKVTIYMAPVCTRQNKKGLNRYVAWTNTLFKQYLQIKFRVKITDYGGVDFS